MQSNRFAQKTTKVHSRFPHNLSPFVAVAVIIPVRLCSLAFGCAARRRFAFLFGLVVFIRFYPFAANISLCSFFVVSRLERPVLRKRIVERRSRVVEEPPPLKPLFKGDIGRKRQTLGKGDFGRKRNDGPFVVILKGEVLMVQNGSRE